MLARIRVPLVFFVAFVLFLGAGSRQMPFVARSSPASAGSTADHTVTAYIKTYGITGAAVAVVRGDEVIYRNTIGHASVELGVPVTPATRFQLSSTTKVFTATLMSVLAEEGLVEYDQAVRHYLPDLPASWSDVSLVDILNHLSGLPEVLDCGEDVAREAALHCVYESQRPAGRREEFRYNQTNYFLVLRVVEAVTGRSFAEALEQKVLRPAGMTSAELNGDSRDVMALRASNYYPDGDSGIRLREYSFPEFLLSAAGLNVSLTDMIAYALALNGDHLLDASGKARMWKVPVMADGSPAGYAQGWELDDMRDGLRSVGHEGGNLTTFRVYPEYDLSVIVLTNGVHTYFSLDELSDQLAKSFASDILAPLDTLAYRAKMAYMTDGLAGVTDVIDASAGHDDFSDDELGEVVTWLAEEMTNIGEADSSAKLVKWYDKKAE